jgi:hypothetical protein
LLFRIINAEKSHDGQIEKFADFFRKRRRAVTEDDIEKEISDASLVITDGARTWASRQELVDDFASDITNMSEDSGGRIIAMAICYHQQQQQRRVRCMTSKWRNRKVNRFNFGSIRRNGSGRAQRAANRF